MTLNVPAQVSNLLVLPQGIILQSSFNHTFLSVWGEWAWNSGETETQLDWAILCKARNVLGKASHKRHETNTFYAAVALVSITVDCT